MFQETFKSNSLENLALKNIIPFIFDLLLHRTSHLICVWTNHLPYIVFVLTYICLETLRKFIRSDKNRKKKKKKTHFLTDYHRSHATRDAVVSPRIREANYLSKFQKEGRNVCSLSNQPDCRVLVAKPLILSGLVRFSM